MDFLIGGMAATYAGLFTNPFDVIKTRQQLEGELEKQIKNTKRLYGTQWQAIKTIVQSEGIVGLQKGLAPALSFQFVLNSTRLGIYETADKMNWTRFDPSMPHSTVLCVFWGGVGGVAGSVIGCPLYMVKTQIQAQSNNQCAVGFQHKHSGMLNALISTYREQGIRRLWRGTEAIAPRTAVGSAVQITTYTLSSDFLSQYETLKQSNILIPLISSMIAGLFLSIGMTPFDVVATRLFNQGLDKNGKGILYRNMFDCFAKTFKYEGVLGLYKGFAANYCRCAPHTVLNLTTWHMLKKWKNILLADEANEMNNFV